MAKKVVPGSAPEVITPIPLTEAQKRTVFGDLADKIPGAFVGYPVPWTQQLTPGQRQAIAKAADFELSPDWWQAIEGVRTAYAQAAAAQSGGITYTDLETELAKLDAAAGKLLDLISNATPTAIGRIEKAAEQPLERDTFYPILSALRHRTFKALTTAAVEKKQDLSPFASFVFALANECRLRRVEVSAADIKETEAAPSRFVVFALRIYETLPPSVAPDLEIRDEPPPSHIFQWRGKAISIEKFSAAIDDVLRKWRERYGVPSRRSAKNLPGSAN